VLIGSAKRPIDNLFNITDSRNRAEKGDRLLGGTGMLLPVARENPLRI
jgi:hypothetical protein